MERCMTNHCSRRIELLLFFYLVTALPTKNAWAFSSRSSTRIPAMTSIQRSSSHNTRVLSFVVGTSFHSARMMRSPHSSRIFALNQGTPVGVSTQNDTAATIVTTDETEDPAIRSLEKTMAEFHRRKEKVQAELARMDINLSTLKKVKTDYMQGVKLGIQPDMDFKESSKRSAVKAFMWRIIAGSITFFTSLRYTGNVKYALSIVGSDFFSKALTMFLGERLMNKSKAGRKKGADNTNRSLAKALIWRVFAICNTLTMSLIVAKDLSMASKIAGSDAVFKTGLMFGYERVWAKVEWGKKYFTDFII